MTDQNMPQKTQPVKTKNDTAKAASKRTGQDKFFYMKFHPDFIDNLRNRLCAALALETHAKLPLYFRSPHAFPAAIGLGLELENRYNIEDGSAAHRALNETLKGYFRSSQYINAMCAMSKRYTLDMDISGELQDGERDLYQRRLRARRRVHHGKTKAGTGKQPE